MTNQEKERLSKQNKKKQPKFAQKHLDAINKQNEQMPKALLAMLQ